MCGIIGYIGENEVKNILLSGLKKLEYRGYDSSGVAIFENGMLKIIKTNGRLANLKEKLSCENLSGKLGIGHTRWATHGEPSEVNAHPHFNKDRTIAVVHNGIIENYEQLKKALTDLGYEFISQTDTEVIAHMVDYYYNGDILDAVIKATEKLEGSYALGVICASEPDKIVSVRKDSPLIVGVSDDGNYIASDIPAIIDKTRNVYFVEDKEFVVIKKDGVMICDAGKNIINREIHHITYDVSAAEKDGYEHFMLKEIHEQAKAVRDTISGRINADLNVSFDNLEREYLNSINKIWIVACGTAYHAGLTGKYVIEKLARINVETELASEFRYKNPILDESTLVVVISQSGETADTLAALRLAKKEGRKTLAITNVVGSTISREADFVIYTHAGPEIAVASTKAYTTQLVAMYMFALFLAEYTKTTDKYELDTIKEELLNLPSKTEKVFDEETRIKSIAQKLCNEKSIFYLGRGLDYATCMEGSLKLKEISYIHSESYAGGELKHGPIALIEDGTVVVAVITNASMFGKMASNIKEVKSRGAYAIGIVPENFDISPDLFDEIIRIPSTNEILYPILSAIPLQLLSYYTAVEKGCDVDKPRNLAKSVTVE